MDVPAPAEVASAPEARPTGSILLIDDDQSSREALAHLLSGEGYAVRIAPGGVEGLSAVAQAPPDIVLLDMMMPGLDGIDVVRRIREDPTRRDLRIVALTGDVTRERTQRAREAGVDDFIGKPFHLTKLLEVLRQPGRKSL